MYALNAVFVWLYNGGKTHILFPMLRGGFLQMEHLCLFLSHTKIPYEKALRVVREYIVSALEELKKVVEPFLAIRTQTL